jgi:predicted anti-sigma-YlaC factor YlaD
MPFAVELRLYGVLGSWLGRSCNVFIFLASNSSARALVESNQAAQSNRSRRKGNTLGWVVWALMSVMLVCIVLWAATGAVALLFGAVLAALGVLYMVLLTNL